MTAPVLPLLVEPDALEQSLGTENLLVVDLSKAETYARLHIPGAVHLDYPQIIAARRPVMGLLPDDTALERLFSAIGIDNDTHVVAYDDEGGGRASRLLWTLAAAGHARYSLLNGGLHSWANEGHPLDAQRVTPVAKSFTVRRDPDPVATREHIRAHLGDSAVCLLDVRTPEEFSGVKRFAEHGGHIPGAVNMDWTLAIDSARNLRFKPDAELRALLSGIGATPEREVITYCQTHHRSAHTWLVLKYLGYPHARGYPGSWSDWGNDPAMPVE
ncbi:MAG: sulfurtransferase [Pseudomonadota bacterium]